MKTYDKIAQDNLVTEKETGMTDEEYWEYSRWDDEYDTSYREREEYSACGVWGCCMQIRRVEEYSACGVWGCCMQIRRVEEMEGWEYTYDGVDNLVKMWFTQQVEDDELWWGNSKFWMRLFIR